MTNKERGVGKFVKENKGWFAIGVPGAVLGSYLLVKHLENRAKDAKAKEVLGNTAREILNDFNASLGSNAIHPLAENAAQDIGEIKGEGKRQAVRTINRIAKALRVPSGMKTLAEKITGIALITGEKIKEIREKEEKI